jgi:hypothetical protein
MSCAIWEVVSDNSIGSIYIIIYGGNIDRDRRFDCPYPSNKVKKKIED